MNIGKLGNSELGWRGVLDLYKCGNELSLDLHQCGNELSLDLHECGNELSLDLHKSGTELSFDLHINELPKWHSSLLDFFKSTNIVKTMSNIMLIFIVNSCH